MLSTKNIRGNKMIKKEQNDNINDFNIKVPRLILLTDWNKHFNYPTLGTLRKLVFNSETNGFNNVIRRIGSRILINTENFFQWVDESK